MCTCVCSLLLVSSFFFGTLSKRTDTLARVRVKQPLNWIARAKFTNMRAIMSKKLCFYEATDRKMRIKRERERSKEIGGGNLNTTATLLQVVLNRFNHTLRYSEHYFQWKGGARMLLSPSPWSAVTVVVVIVAIFFAPHQPDDGSRGVCVCVCALCIYISMYAYRVWI